MLVTALEANVEVPDMALVTERLLHEERKLSEKRKQLEGKEITKEKEEALASGERVWEKDGPRCYKCGKIGHIRRNCGDWGKERPRGDRFKDNRFQNKRALRVEEEYSGSSEEESTGLLSLQGTQEGIRDKWIIDSGASSHMCKEAKLFDSIHRFRRQVEVKVGDGRSLWAVGRGSVGILVNNMGKKRCILREVLYVPKLAFNLFSVTKAAEAGKSTEFTKEGCTIREGKSGALVAVGYKRKRLYYLDEGREVECTHVASESLGIWGDRQ